MDPSVKNRYFKQFDFNPSTSPEYFLASKPQGTFRIFCLGGSTTVGYPYWYNGAISSFLRDRLKTIFPKKSIEVINVGMTATNSYTVLDLGADLTKYDPDLFIVYDGHNEFYGALGVASNESSMSSRWITLLYLKAIHLKTFQLLKNIVSGTLNLFSTASGKNFSHATMMEQVARGKFVPYGNDVYKEGLSVFRQNMEDLKSICREHNIPLILGTQASNLRDQEPFISNNSPAISDLQRSEFQQLFKKGLEVELKSLEDSAIVLFRSSINIDSLYADVHFQLAKCLDKTGRKKEALYEYTLARDYDELRFRTDSRYNDLIRSMDDGKNCFVADIENVFKSNSKDSLIGYNLILEHLHPNSKANFLIAKEYSRKIRDQNILASANEWAKHDTVKDEYLWTYRHVTPLDETIAAQRTEYITSSWPYKKPISVNEIFSTNDTLSYIADQTIHNKFSWKIAHTYAAEYYQRYGNYNNTIWEYETIINQLPHDVAGYLRLAHIFFDLNLFPKAESLFLTSLKVKQTAIAYRVLGDIYMKERKVENAIHMYEEVNKFPAEPSTAPENSYMLALAYLLAKKTDSAIKILNLTVNRYPSYKPAKELLLRIKQGESNNPVK